MTKPTPKLLQHALSETIGELGIGRRLKEFEIIDRWHEIVGEQISRVTIPEWMEGGKLHIHVTRSTWRNELLFLKTELMSKLNAAVGEEIVNDIIFR